jgi:hypothetical protein
MCGLVCPSRTSERQGKGDCVKGGGGEEGECAKERASGTGESTTTDRSDIAPGAARAASAASAATAVSSASASALRRPAILLHEMSGGATTLQLATFKLMRSAAALAAASPTLLFRA